MTPIMEKIAGKKMSADERDKALAECRAAAKDGKGGKDAAMMKCVLDAADDDAVKACLTGAMQDYQNKSKATEAKLNLNKLAKELKVYYVTQSSYPAGSAATLPAGECCKGPNNKCPVDASWSKDPVWSALDFQMDEPAVYRYSYTSDGKTATATAVGDPACDGHVETYTLNVTAENGNPKVEIVEPKP